MPLADRLAAGEMLLTESVQHVVELADRLRSFHEAGRAHGAISPATVAVNGSGAFLQDAPEQAAVIGYTAPEIRAGQPPSPQSDIFSLGALLYHLVTKRTPPASAEEAASNPCGHPVLDRIVLKCLAPEPMMRYQSAQKLAIELRLLGVAGKLNGGEGPARWEQEMECLRVETAASLREHETQVIEFKRSTNEAIVTLRQELAAGEQRAARIEESLGQHGERLEQTVRTLDEQVRQIKAVIESTARQNAEVHQAAEAARLALEASVAGQGGRIDSVLAGIKQTDDLLAWVVEIIESLQNSLMEE